MSPRSVRPSCPRPHGTALRAAAAIAPLLTVVLFTGSVRAGEAPEVAYRFLDLPVEHHGPTLWRLTDQGTVLWQKTVSDGDGGQRECLFSFGTGIGAELCEGDPVPDRPGVEFSELFTTVMMAGHLAVHARIAGPGVTSLTNTGLWIRVNSGWTNPVLENDDAPDLDDIRFDGFTALRLNRHGRICFGATLRGTGIDGSNRDSLWCRSPNEDPVLLARTGDDAPARPPGDTVLDFEIYAGTAVDTMELDDAGRAHLIFETDSGYGLFGLHEVESRSIAFEGEIPPGGGDAFVNFSTIGAEPSPEMQGPRGAAFHARLGSLSTVGIFAQGGAGLRLVAKTGDVMPGGATLQFPALFAGNARGDVVFEDNASNGDDLALYAEIAGELVQLVEIGDLAPGAMSATDVFRQFSGRASMNEAGQVFFEAEIGHPAGSTSDSLWVHDPDQGPVLLAEVFSDLDDGGNLRTVAALNYTGDSTDLYGGLRASHNERAEVLFWVRFDDDTQAFVVARLLPSSFVHLDGYESGDLEGWGAR